MEGQHRSRQLDRKSADIVKVVPPSPMPLSGSGTCRDFARPHTLVAASESDGGLGVQLVFRREIVWPDGRKEIEGVTPKALPVPEPDETKAIEP